MHARGGMLGMDGALLLVILASSFVSHVIAKDLGQPTGPYSSAGVELSAVGLHYAKIDVKFTSLPVCSGVRTVFALTYHDQGTQQRHEIAVSFSQHSHTTCASSRHYAADGSITAVELHNCSTPVADLWRKWNVATIAWGPRSLEVSIAGTLIGQWTDIPLSPSHRYHMNHTLSFTSHFSTNESQDGIPTTVCEPNAVKIQEVVVNGYDRSSGLFNLPITLTALSGTSWGSWAGRSEWSRAYSHFLQHGSEIFLTRNVQISTDGLLLWTGLVDTFHGDQWSVTGSNMLFSEPQLGEWKTFLDANARSQLVYDPYSIPGSGVLNFTITVTGDHPNSITLYQDMTPLDVSTDDPFEYCLHLNVASTQTRNVAVALMPTTSPDPIGQSKYFGTWTLEIAEGGYTVYSRCFTDETGKSEPVQLQLHLGGVGRPLHHQHTISFASIIIRRLERDARATRDWAQAQTVGLNRHFSNPGDWIVSTTVGASMSFGGGSMNVQFNQNNGVGTHPRDVQFYQAGISLEKDAVYRLVVNGRENQSTRFFMAGVQYELLPASRQQYLSFYGGLSVVEISPTQESHELVVFKAVNSSRLNIEDGGVIAPDKPARARIAVYLGGPALGKKTDVLAFTEVSLLKWIQSVPTPKTMPPEPEPLPRPPAETTESPFNPIPTSLATFSPSPSAITPPPVLIPTSLLKHTDYDSLVAQMYKHPLYKLVFSGITVEDIDVDKFRKEVGLLLRVECGFAAECNQITEGSVVILEVCYSNLRAPNNATGHAIDRRACRGLGSPINFLGSDANATGIESYLAFTFAALPETQPQLAAETLEKLNNSISFGTLHLNGLVSGVLPIPPPPPPPTQPPSPPGQHGLTTEAWLGILISVAFVTVICAFLVYYNHRVDQLRRKAGDHNSLYKQHQDQEMFPIPHTHEEGLLQLEQLGKLKQQFDLIDSDNGGTLDKKEIRDVLHLMSIEVSEEEFEKFFRSIDEDGNEEIEFSEFAVGFIPFLHGETDSQQGDRIFAALTSTSQHSSIFQQREIDPESSDRLIRETPFLERRAAKFVESFSRQRHERMDGGDGGNDDDDVTIEIGEMVVVTRNVNRWNVAEDRMVDLQCEIPSFALLQGKVGRVEEIEDVDEDRMLQVKFNDIDEPLWLPVIAVDPKEDRKMVMWIPSRDRRKARRLENYMVIRAVVIGLLSAGLSALAEQMAERYYNKETRKEPQNSGDFWSSFSFESSKKSEYWAIVIPTVVILSITEIIVLYMDALRTTMRISELFGLVLYPMDEERRFFCSALARCCLELGNLPEKLYNVNPSRESSPLAASLANLAYKAKSGVSTFLLRMSFKRLLSRVGAKAAQAYLAVPVVMIANGLVATLVLSNARTVSLAPRLISLMLEHNGSGQPPRWHLGSYWVVVEHFEKLTVQILRAIGCIVVARQEWHPSLEYLYTLTRQKLGVRNFKSDDDEDQNRQLEDDLRLKNLIRSDCCPSHDVDCLSKLIDALRLDYESVRVIDDSYSESVGSQSDNSVALSLHSYRSEPPIPTPLAEEEKKLILRFMVLAVLVSGPPNARTMQVVGEAFAAAGGDITNKPHKTISSLYHLFKMGDLEAVVENFELVFQPHRVMKGDRRSLFSRIGQCMVSMVDLSLSTPTLPRPPPPLPPPP
eukprot:Sspe_Gene.86237::Locus_56949_Transcript_2_2_Confidence_0.800_Length_4971::g.86237::m.86237